MRISRDTAWVTVQLVIPAVAITCVVATMIAHDEYGHALVTGLSVVAVWGGTLCARSILARRRRRVQEPLLAEASSDYAVPVRWQGTKASKRDADELTPDVAGVLIADPEAYTLVTREGGVRRAHRLERSRTQVRWIGRTGRSPLQASWFALDMDARRLLVTAETGALPFGSRHATRSIYEHLVQRSAAPAAASG